MQLTDDALSARGAFKTSSSSRFTTCHNAGGLLSRDKREHAESFILYTYIHRESHGQDNSPITHIAAEDPCRGPFSSFIQAFEVCGNCFELSCDLSIFTMPVLLYSLQALRVGED